MLKSAKKQTIKLRVSPGDKLNVEIYKYPYHIFESSMAEKLMLWKK